MGARIASTGCGWTRGARRPKPRLRKPRRGRRPTVASAWEASYKRPSPSGRRKISPRSWRGADGRWDLEGWSLEWGYKLVGEARKLTDDKLSSNFSPHGCFDGLIGLLPLPGWARSLWRTWAVCFVPCSLRAPRGWTKGSRLLGRRASQIQLSGGDARSAAGMVWFMNRGDAKAAPSFFSKWKLLVGTILSISSTRHLRSYAIRCLKFQRLFQFQASLPNVLQFTFQVLCRNCATQT